MADKKRLRIVFSVVLQDAGEATRAIEIAGGIREYCPLDYELDIIFLSRGSRFEQRVIDSGFQIHKCHPALLGKGFREDFKTTDIEIIGDAQLAQDLLAGEIQALEELQPDIVMHGFWPIAGLARRMVKKPTVGICYMPTPFQRDLFGTTLMKDIPDIMKPLTYLPLAIRRTIFKSIPKFRKLKSPVLRQKNIISAAKSFEWSGEPVKDLFDTLKADFTIINDFEDFYKEDKLPEDFKVVGPLYAPAANSDIDSHILKIFNRETNKINIFCTLGSSGEKQRLFEAIKALKEGIGKEWNAVVLAPPAICTIDEALSVAENSPNIYITDAFVPAPLVNALADVVISHGGQGTIQTAIASGTPIVGFAMQPEQQINLDHVAMRGAAIRIPLHKWNSTNIQSAVKKIVRDPSYKEKMKELQKIIKSVDGKKEAALAIWEYIMKVSG